MVYTMKPLGCDPQRIKGMSGKADRQPLREQLRRRCEAASASSPSSSRVSTSTRLPIFSSMASSARS